MWPPRSAGKRRGCIEAGWKLVERVEDALAKRDASTRALTAQSEVARPT
jgi:hypothetical protein